MSDPQASTSASGSSNLPIPPSKGKKPEITAEISPSDAYLLAMKVRALGKFDDRAVR